MYVFNLVFRFLCTPTKEFYLVSEKVGNLLPYSALIYKNLFNLRIFAKKKRQVDIWKFMSLTIILSS